MFESNAYAQVSIEDSGRLMLPQNMQNMQNMAIDGRFQYSGLKINRQQKEQWSREVFMTDVSQTMKIENLQQIELTEVDFANNRSNNRLELVDF